MRTASTYNLPTDDAFQRFIWISLTIHVVLFFGFTVKTLFLPSDTVILQNAIRVDVVALPDKLPTTEAPAAKIEKAPTPVAAPKHETKKPDAIALKKDVKKAQEDALNKLKQREALERLKGQKNDTPEPPKKKNLYAGNQVSQGDKLTGLEHIAFDEYTSGLVEKVHENYTLPDWLKNSQLKCAVELTIDDAGKVLKISLAKSSGNPTFDGAAMNAVQVSAPFPPVPERLTRAWSSFTIVFSFPEN